MRSNIRPRMRLGYWYVLNSVNDSSDFFFLRSPNKLNKVSWLYTGNLEGPHPGSPLLLSSNIPNELDDISVDWKRVITRSEYNKEEACVKGDIWTLVNLWILAEYLILPRLQNLAFNKVFALDEKFAHVIMIYTKFICEETATDSMLRKYIFDRCVAIVTPRLVPEIRRLNVFLKRLPESFKDDWIAALLEFLEEHKGLRPKEEYHVPLSRTLDDLAHELPISKSEARKKGVRRTSSFSNLGF
jgi:hypothetical protein